MPLKIEVSFRPWKNGSRMARLVLDGTLDTGTAPQLEHELATIFEEATEIITFDLGALVFLSSGGVRVILAARKHVIERNGSCMLVNMQPQIEGTFAIIRALEGIQYFSDDDALDTFLGALQQPLKEGETAPA